MKIFKHNKQRGFSLMEMLIYLAIFGTISVGIMGVVWNVTKIHSRQIASTEVDENLRYVMNLVNQKVREASLINSATGTTLSLTMSDSAKSPTVFSLSDGVLYIQEGNSEAVAITSNRVNVDSLSFESVSMSGAKGGAKIGITISYKDNGKPDQIFSKNLFSTVSRVSAVTFDSDLLPASNNLYSVGADNPRWKNGFFSGTITATGDITSAGYVYGTTGLCIAADCRTSWSSSGVTGSGTANYIPRWASSSALENSIIYDDGTKIGIGKANPGTTLDVNGSITATNFYGNAKQIFYGVTGGSTSAWTATISGITAYSDNLMVVLKPGYASGSATTLDINGLGAKKIYYGSTSQSSYFSANYTYMFVYDSTKDSGNGAFTGVASYDSDSNAYMLRYVQAIKAAADIVAANIICGTNSGYQHLKTGAAFDISLPILWAQSAISNGSTGTNNYLVYYGAIATTQALTLTAYAPVYIKGTLSGKTFTPVSTTPLTQTEPSTDDGYDYMLLGYAYSTTSMYLNPTHDIFRYKNGVFGVVNTDIKGVSGLDGATPVTVNILSTNDGTWTDNSIFSQVTFSNSDTSGAGDGGVKAKISAYVDDTTGEDAGLSFYTSTDGTSIAERMKIDHQGYVGIGQSVPVSLLTIQGGSANWNETTPGLGVGPIHLDPGVSTDHYGSAITWGASDAGNGDTAQAGIYVRTDGSYGTKMYIATTDVYASGSKTRVMIDYNGNVGINDTTPSYALDVTGTINFTTKLMEDGVEIFSGMIAMFDAACPTGWTRFTGLDSKFPRGAASYGGTGGASTHTHAVGTFAVDIASFNSNQPNYASNWLGGGSEYAVYADHVHAVNPPSTAVTGTSGSTDHTPPYLDMIYCKKNAGADYAEWTKSKENYIEGTIVSLDKSQAQTMMASEKEYDDSAIGIISANPGWTVGQEQEGYQMLALNGRVPVLVSLINGPIKIGDPITTSNIKGVGMKATKPGQIIGKAMENFDENSKTVVCKDVSGKESKCGMVMAFVNVSWYGGNSGILNYIFEELKQIFSPAINWTENAFVKVKELVAEKIFTKKIRLEELEMVDQKTGDIYCVWIEQGEMKKIKGECGE